MPQLAAGVSNRNSQDTAHEGVNDGGRIYRPLVHQGAEYLESSNSSQIKPMYSFNIQLTNELFYGAV